MMAALGMAGGGGGTVMAIGLKKGKSQELEQKEKEW